MKLFGDVVVSNNVIHFAHFSVSLNVVSLYAVFGVAITSPYLATVVIRAVVRLRDGVRQISTLLSDGFYAPVLQPLERYLNGRAACWHTAHDLGRLKPELKAARGLFLKISMNNNATIFV